jgi:hypothetical protein
MRDKIKNVAGPYAEKIAPTAFRDAPRDRRGLSGAGA